MIYLVEWSDLALQLLAAIWLAAINRNAITAASQAIDLALETSPSTIGVVVCSYFPFGKSLVAARNRLGIEEVMDIEAILKQIQELPEEQREDLFYRLDELYDEPEASIVLTEKTKALLDERSEEADANPGVGYSMEEVIEYIRRKRS